MAVAKKKVAKKKAGISQEDAMKALQEETQKNMEAANSEIAAVLRKYNFRFDVVQTINLVGGPRNPK